MNTKWISVDKRLPKNYVTVAVVAEGASRAGYCFPDRTWWVHDSYFQDVTHWMPLPKAPRQRKKQEGGK